MWRTAHHALAREAILACLTVYQGITTADGAVGGGSLIDSNLIGSNDFITNKMILIGSGDTFGEDMGAASFNPLTGEITFVAEFSAQIKAGTLYRILNVSAVEKIIHEINEKIGESTDLPGVATLFGRLALIIVGLAGETPVSGDTTANWNSGVATSGNAGADLVTLGAADTRHKVHALLVSIANLSPGATIRVRMYMEINGTEREVYNQVFTQGTDPDGLWVINGTLGIHEALRVEVHSDNAADDGAVVEYDYMTGEV